MINIVNVIEYVNDNEAKDEPLKDVAKNDSDITDGEEPMDVDDDKVEDKEKEGADAVVDTSITSNASSSDSQPKESLDLIQASPEILSPSKRSRLRTSPRKEKETHLLSFSPLQPCPP